MKQSAVRAILQEEFYPRSTSETLARLAGAELVVLEDSGHVPYVEQPDALFAALVPFLERTVPPAG